jgi:hypothetical protein
MKVNYLFQFMVALTLTLVATTVKATDISVTGTDRTALLTAMDAAQPGDVILIGASITLNDKVTFNKKVTFKGVGDNIEIKPAEGYTWRLFDLVNEGEGEKTVFENLIFTGANNTGDADGNEKDGGAGRLLGGAVEFIQCKIAGNKSANRGGALYIDNTQVTFTDCEISDNQSYSKGGAFFVVGSTQLNIESCKMTGNNASDERGGVFFLENAPSTTTIKNTRIENNSVGKVEELGGNGGGVFTVWGQATLNVYNSSIINNNCYGNHGGVLFQTGSNSNITFANTTIARNRMWSDSNSMFRLEEKANLTFVNVTMVGNYGNYNTGNAAGININHKDSRIIIYNSIIAGNTANNGASVDIRFTNSDIAENIANNLEIKNSIIGYIKGASQTQVQTILGYETSIINEYAETQDWRNTEKSGIQWEEVTGDYSSTPPVSLQTEDNQKYVPIAVSYGTAVGLGDPALLAAYADPLIDQIGMPREGEKITAGAVEYVKGENPLPLDGVNLIWGDTYSYDKETHTLSFADKWGGGVGWEFAEVKDWSAYSKVTVEFTEPLITGVALHVQYTDGSVNGNPEDAYVGKGSTSVTISLDKEKRDQVKKVYFQMQNDGERDGAPGTVTIKDAYLVEEGYMLPYSIDKLNYFDGTTYNSDIHTITYNNGWSYAGWNWDADGGLDVSEYDQIWIKFDASALPKTGDGEGGATKLQYQIGYMDEDVPHKEVRSNTEEVFFNLTPGKKLKYVFLKSEAPGTVVLTDAYLYKREIEPVDLIITDIRWEPENPAPGDDVTFFATIKNISDKDSPANVKHGVVFKNNTTTLSWADGFYGPVAAGSEIEISTRGEGSTGNLWKAGKNQTYVISAQVNDTEDVPEIDYTNNIFQKSLMIEGTVDFEILSIATTPAAAAGRDLTFSAMVKNNGSLNSPEGVLLTFSVDGNIVSQNDNGPAFNAGEQKRITATSQWKWEADREGFVVTVVINGGENGEHPIIESDYTNNTFNASYGLTGIRDVVANGKVYVDENGTLHVEGYPSALVTVYNILGRKITGTTSETASINLAAGTYIVNIRCEGKVITCKVLVK